MRSDGRLSFHVIEEGRHARPKPGTTGAASRKAHRSRHCWLTCTCADCPRISKEFLAEELKALGPRRYSEEYELAFIDSDEAMFPSAVIDAAFTSEVTPLWQ
jgi:hypothetical protein